MCVCCALQCVVLLCVWGAVAADLVEARDAFFLQNSRGAVPEASVGGGPQLQSTSLEVQPSHNRFQGP